MAYYRQVYITFWSDPKVQDDFTPEDRYFYLYLLTNPHTNLCGCYEVSKKQMSNDTGYNVDTISRLLERMTETHEVIKYNDRTKEVLLLNWHKYNWSSSPKFLKGVANEAGSIKCEDFKQTVLLLLDSFGYPMDTVSAQKAYPMDTSVTVTDTVTVIEDINIEPLTEEEQIDNYLLDLVLSTRLLPDYYGQHKKRTVEEDKKNNDHEEDIREIIRYLNERVGTNFRPNTYETVKKINGRFSEGYTLDDFKKVIDTKADEWLGTAQEQYLRPITLFAQSNFENYLQQKKRKNKKQNNDPYDWDAIEARAREADIKAGRIVDESDRSIENNQDSDFSIFKL